MNTEQPDPTDAEDDDDEDGGQVSTPSTDSDPKLVALMHEVDNWISHIWMVRTFLKHSDEATDDEELAEIHRGLYDFMLALGPSKDAGDAARYLRIARKKISKLRKTSAAFRELQPEVSGHMNFRMAAQSLSLAVHQIEQLLQQPLN